MQRSYEELSDIIITLIAEQLSLDKHTVKAESTLDSLGADSLDQVEIIIKLQEEFGIEIDDDSAEKIITVAQAIDYVQKHTST